MHEDLGIFHELLIEDFGISFGIAIENFGIFFGFSFEVQENIAIFAHNL